MRKSHPEPVRIAIIGAGNVGATTAHPLLLSGRAVEIVLIDMERSKAEGQTMDLNHPSPLLTRLASGPETMRTVRVCDHRHGRGRNQAEGHPVIHPICRHRKANPFTPIIEILQPPNLSQFRWARSAIIGSNVRSLPALSQKTNHRGALRHGLRRRRLDSALQHCSHSARSYHTAASQRATARTVPGSLGTDSLVGQRCVWRSQDDQCPVGNCSDATRLSRCVQGTPLHRPR